MDGERGLRTYVFIVITTPESLVNGQVWETHRRRISMRSGVRPELSND